MKRSGTVSVASDRLGNPVSNASPSLVEALDRFTQRFLTFDSGTGEILEHAADAPANVTAGTLAAGLCLLDQDSAAGRDPTPFVERAQAHAREALPAERTRLAAVSAWAAGQPATALAHFEQLAHSAPRDAVGLLLGTTLAYLNGNRDQQRRLPEIALRRAGDIGYVWGMAAFGREETGAIDAAADAVHTAMAIDPVDPGAHHAMAHVYLCRQDAAGGLAWMDRHRSHWAGSRGDLRNHNWWHVALFHLALERIEPALDVYNRHIASGLDTPGGMQNAIGLLARLDLLDHPLQERWQAIAQQIRDTPFWHRRPFLDLLRVYALGRGGAHGRMDGAIDALRGKAEEDPPSGTGVWHHVVLPAAMALSDYCHGHWRRAADRLDGLASVLPRIGASNEERQVFPLIAAHARRRAGR